MKRDVEEMYEKGNYLDIFKNQQTFYKYLKEAKSYKTDMRQYIKLIENEKENETD